MNTISITGCPTDLDERTELYCLDRLQPAEARSFEQHLVNCPVCLYEVLETDLFLESLRSALRELTEDTAGLQA